MRVIVLAFVMLASAACLSSDTLRSIQGDLARLSQSQVAADAGLEERLARYSDEMGDYAAKIEALEAAGEGALDYADLGLGGGALAIIMNYLRDRKYVNKAKAADAAAATASA